MVRVDVDVVIVLNKAGCKSNKTGYLLLIDKQFVDPKFDVQVVAVARSVNNSHLSAPHDNYYLQFSMEIKLRN